MTLEPDDMFTIRDNQAISSPNVFIKCSTTGGMLQTDFYISTSKTATISSTEQIPRAQPSLYAKYWILVKNSLPYIISPTWSRFFTYLNDVSIFILFLGIPDIGDIDPVDVSYLIFNQDEKKIASTEKIRKALSW